MLSQLLRFGNINLSFESDISLQTAQHMSCATNLLHILISQPPPCHCNLSDNEVMCHHNC